MIMRPTLRQLQYLVAVADTGLFGEAAKRMHVSQPSLSAQVADAEAQLGAVLLERGRGGAVLTPKGQDVVTRARIILRQVEEMKTAVRRGEGELSGRIRLGVLPTVGPYLLPNAVKRLHGMFPNLRLSVRDERTVDLVQHLEDGRLDTIISSPEDHRSGGSMPLFHEEMWICVAPDHPLADARTPIKLKALKGGGLLSLGAGHRLSLIIQYIADQAGAEVSTEYEGTSLDAIRQMAAMGAGVAILPSLYALTEAARDPDLVIRRIDHATAQRDIALIWRPTSPLADDFKLLGDVLSDVANELLPVDGAPT